jgi:hypothetical protein
MRLPLTLNFVPAPDPRRHWRCVRRNSSDPSRAFVNTFLKIV